MTTAEETGTGWTNVASIREALASAELVDRALLAAFDASNALHVTTLVALAPEERRTLFAHCSAWPWNKRGLCYATLALTDGWVRAGRFAEALSLLDDLVTASYQEPQTYQLALWAVMHANSGLGIQPERARAYLARGLPHGSEQPAIFHNAACLYEELGDRASARQAVRCALRYGYAPDILAYDADLASLWAEADLAALVRAPEIERSTLLLRDRLATLEPDETPIAHSPRRIAARALVLAALSWRASLPGQRPLVLPADHQQTAEEVATMRQWLTERGLDDELDPAEAAFLGAPLTTHMTPACIDRSWSLEAAAWLGWALGRLPQPQYQQKLDASPLAALGLGTAAGDALLATETLRPPDVLRRLHRQLLPARWRLEVRRITPGARVALEQLAGDLPLDLRYVTTRDGDLAVANKPLATAPEAKVDRVASLTLERHRASTWLVAPAGTRMCDVDTKL